MVQMSRKFIVQLLVTSFLLLRSHCFFQGYRLKDSAYFCRKSWALEITGHHPREGVSTSPSSEVPSRQVNVESKAEVSLPTY